VRQIGLADEGDTTMHAQARERYAAILRRRRRRVTHGDLPAATVPGALDRPAPAQLGHAVRQLTERLDPEGED
jgi:hypothetical protein